MLRPAKNIDGCELRARDGKIGHVVDFFFEDRSWTIRYFVVDTGGWLGGRQVLISPVAVRTPDWSQPSLPVDLTVEQIRRARSEFRGARVARGRVAAHPALQLAGIWMMAGAADGGMGMTVPAPVLPLPLAAAAAVEREAQAIRPTIEHHLRSVKALAGTASKRSTVP